MTSGLKRPPVRSFFRLSTWCSAALAKANSRSERSKGSSGLGLGAPDLEEEAEEEPLSAGGAADFLEPFSGLSALFFLACGADVWEKHRMVEHPKPVEREVATLGRVAWLLR